ncbi:MAG: hypothetical protein NW237_01780 [Cyanobacteriota bacterium]|nr:hypothetical protein [Cyanobacteriota bacterium]
MRVVVTGLDGSLLDSQTNSYGAARQGLAALERRSIPLILFSYRTRRQLEEVRQQLHLEHPFLSEDGQGIYLPEDYFPLSILSSTWVHQPPYYTQSLGLPYAQLRQIVQEIRQQLQADLVGFGDWKTGELALAMGITPDQAERMQAREWSEIFSYGGDPERLETALHDQADRWGCRLHLRTLLQARQYYLTGWPAQSAEPSEMQPRAVSLLLDSYRRHAGSVMSLAIGSEPADAAFLRVASYPVVLPSAQSDMLWSEAGANWHLAELPGPAGWNDAVLTWLEETDHGDELQAE